MPRRRQPLTDYPRHPVVRVLKAVLPVRLRPLGRRSYHGARSAILSIVLAGNRVECPCCGGCFRRFLAFNERPNVHCPRCWSLERHRLLCLYLRRHPQLLPPGAAVLHFAPEDAIQRCVAEFADLRYTSADLTAELAMMKMDVAAIPLADESVDVIICSHVLEHVEDDRAAMREIRRVLRPGGCALVMVPIEHDRETTFEDPHATTPDERARLFGQFDHARSYGLDFPDRLTETGLAVTVVAYLDQLEDETTERHRLRHIGRWGPDEIFVCEKPL